MATRIFTIEPPYHVRGERLLSLLLALLVPACIDPAQADGARDPGLDESSTGGAAETSTHASEGDGETDDTEPSGGEPEACDDPYAALSPLFPAGLDVEPIVSVREDGVIVTRAAGRVRGRHELEELFNPFGARYFESRSYALVIEDHVAAGEDLIEVSYYPEAPVSSFGSTTNLRVWKIYGNGNLFYDNLLLETVDLHHQTKALSGNRREGRPLQLGDTMELELGIFIAGNDPADPGAIEGQTAYYTDTFRYQVGHGGLSPRNDDPSGALGPALEHTLAGATTIPFVQIAEELHWAFSQMALDMQPEHVQSFLEGRRLFHTDFATGEHTEPGNPALPEHANQLGPLFNVASCSECHAHNGRGRAPAEGEVLRTTAVKLYDDETFGAQLQPQEAELVLDHYALESIELADGTTVELRRPIYAGAEPGWSYSPRLARQLPGLGLLEAIDPAQILARATIEGCNDGGAVSGRALVVADPSDGALRLGRLGWKAEKVSVRHQVADALAQDMGVSTSVFPDERGQIELDDADLERIVTYVSLLGLPGRRNANDAQVRHGEDVFVSTGCVACHVQQAFTADTHPLVELREQTIQPFSDLLLHDMGEGLGDPQGGPLAREWRTAPLWGIGLVDEVAGETHLLHDGRARSLLEAILWHGGEAGFASAAVRGMATADREALLAFLGSL